MIEASSSTISARRKFVTAAADLAKINCIWFSIDYAMAKHLQTFLTVTKCVSRPSKPIFEKYYSSLQLPTKSEGFSEIFEVSYPFEFDNSFDKELFNMRLC